MAVLIFGIFVLNARIYYTTYNLNQKTVEKKFCCNSVTMISIILAEEFDSAVADQTINSSR